MSTLNTVLWM